MELILIGLIILLASMVQGATSFGFSLVALPLLGLFMDLKEVVPLLVVLSLLLNLFIAIKLKKKPNLKEILLLFIFAVITMPIGVNLLLFVDEKVLKVSVGVLLIVISVMMIKGFKINIKNRNLAYVITGVLSGILNGAVSLSGPPVVILLSNDQKNKDEFRASLTALFMFLNIVTVAMFINKGLITTIILTSYLLIIPFLLVGTFIGVKIGNKIDDVKFKKIVLFLLVVMGIINLF